MKKYLMNFIALTAMAAFLLTGCTEAASEEKIKEEAKEAADLEIDPEPDAAEEDTQKPEILHFLDVYQNPYQVEINPNVEKHNYKNECFIRSGDLLSYTGDDNYTYRLGVDVSEHQKATFVLIRNSTGIWKTPRQQGLMLESIFSHRPSMKKKRRKKQTSSLKIWQDTACSFLSYTIRKVFWMMRQEQIMLQANSLQRIHRYSVPPWQMQAILP